MRERNKQIYLYDAANFMGRVSGACCEVRTHWSSQLKELWVVRNGSRKRVENRALVCLFSVIVPNLDMARLFRRH